MLTAAIVGYMLKLMCEIGEYLVYEDEEGTYELWIRKDAVEVIPQEMRDVTGGHSK